MQQLRVLDHFAPGDIDAIRALADATEARTGVMPFNDSTWAGLAGRSAHGDRGILLTGRDDSPLGYAHLSHHHPEEWSVELATTAGAREARSDLLRGAVGAVADVGGGTLTLWAHGATPDDDALARNTGFTHDRDLLQMRAPLPLPVEPTWPDGVRVRTFRVGEDEAAWLEVNNRAFDGHPEQGNWTLDEIRARAAEPWFDPEGFLLAFDDVGLAGFCWTKVHAADPPHEPVALGEIYVIGADPRWHGRGLGRALTSGGLQSLAHRGLTVGMLYVDGANAPAIGLYRALGFSDHRLDRAYTRNIDAHVVDASSS